MSRVYRDYHSFSCQAASCAACDFAELLLSAFAERNNSDKNGRVAGAFFSETIGEVCACRMCNLHNMPIRKVSDWLVRAILEIPEDDFLGLMRGISPGEAFAKGDIPQISSFDEVQNVSTIVSRTGESYTLEQMGSMLENALGDRRAHYARIKYGENHAKFAAMMGLADLRKNNKNQYIITRTALGLSLFMLEDQAERRLLIRRLMFRCRMFRNMFFLLDDEKRHLIESGLASLERTTRLRRFRTLKALARAYNHLGDDSCKVPEEVSAWLGI